MTTQVTVKTCNWPVRVCSIEIGDDGRCVEGAAWTDMATVPPNSEQTFYIHQNLDICVSELPEPKPEASPATATA